MWGLRLASQGRSVPCRRASPAVPLLTRALAPPGQGRPGTASEPSQVPEAQRPWAAGMPPMEGLACAAQWRRDAAGSGAASHQAGLLRPGRHSRETFPAARPWVRGPQRGLGTTSVGARPTEGPGDHVRGCAAHRGAWGQPDGRLLGRCHQTGASDGSGLWKTRAPGTEGSSGTRVTAPPGWREAGGPSPGPAGRCPGEAAVRAHGDTCG